MKIRLPRLPATFRLGTLQLVLLAAACTAAILAPAAQRLYKAHELELVDAEQMASQAAIVSLRDEIRRLRQYDRVISALEFLSQGKLDGADLLQTSRMLCALSRSVGFDPLLILAVVSVESRGNPYAQGRFRSGDASGAVGLMQIKFETARLVGKRIGTPIRVERELLRPDVNLLYGTAYLLQMVNRYGSLEKGLVAYNIGPGTLEQKMTARTRLPRRYYNRVLSNYRGLVNRFGEDPFARRLEEE